MQGINRDRHLHQNQKAVHRLNPNLLKKFSQTQMLQMQWLNCPWTTYPVEPMHNLKAFLTINHFQAVVNMSILQKEHSTLEMQLADGSLKRMVHSPRWSDYDES